MRTGAWPAQTTPQLQTEAQMVKAIREEGRIPVQRNTFYEAVKEWPTEGKPSNSPTAGSALTPPALEATVHP